MSDWIIFGIGFLAQLLFSARLVTQWVLSEKSQKVETPVVFWKLSLLGAILLFLYGYLRHDLAIMLGQFLIYAVYIRNLKLQGEWKKSRWIFKVLVIVFPFVVAWYLLFYDNLEWSSFLKGENLTYWLIGLGVFAQIVYTSRFFYQWYHAEATQKSSLPKGFWILSLMGSSLLLTYGIFRNDPVLILAHFFGGAIYIRELYILNK